MYAHPSIECSSHLNSVASAFLQVLKEEDLVFWLLIGLIEKYDLKSIFGKKLLAVDLHMYLIGALLEGNVPELSGCLKNSGTAWSCLAKELVLTLGTSCVPTDFVPQVLDVFFMDGWIGLYRIAITLFSKCAAEISKATPDNCTATLKKAVTSKDMQEILQHSVQVQVSKTFLEKSVSSFFVEEATKCLDKNFDPKEWPDKLAKQLRESSDKISELTEQHEVDMRFFTQKLVKLEASLLEYLRTQH